MSLRFLLASSSVSNYARESILQGLRCAQSFHSSSNALKGKGPGAKGGKLSRSPKRHSKPRFKATSRTRLVKDLNPRNPQGRRSLPRSPEVASRAPTRTPVTLSARKDSSPASRKQGERPTGSRQPLKTSEPYVSKATEERAAVEALLDSEFDRTSSQQPLSSSALPSKFASPPLLPGLALSMTDILGADAHPTPIQSLALRHLMSLSHNSRGSVWKEFLLASETGSGKSFAYLLPLIQYLKETEGKSVSPSNQPHLIHPRALVLAPTHELTRQLSVFAKSLVHHERLRVMCASRANVPTRNAESGVTARQMKHSLEAFTEEGGERKEVKQRPLDVLVGTPVKTLEMVRGWGWDKVGKEERDWEREERDGKKAKPFRPGKAEMGLSRVEFVVVDEADVLFDPDFRETTLHLLSDICAARGHQVPSTSEKQPISYPFHLVLTSATVPASLSTYLSTFHPSLTRLASPHLHRLPASLYTEHVPLTGGQRFSDVERRLRRVWAEDALRGPDPATGRFKRSKVLVFCNRSSGVEFLGRFLTDHGIPNVALTSTSEVRARGSNRHIEGFLKGHEHAAKVSSVPEPHVLITTSLLSRGLDFSPEVKHVFVVDPPRNMVDFLHRAGRAGRAGEWGRVVVFGRLKGRGSSVHREMKDKVKALAR